MSPITMRPPGAQVRDDRLDPRVARARQREHRRRAVHRRHGAAALQEHRREPAGPRPQVEDPLAGARAGPLAHPRQHVRVAGEPAAALRVTIASYRCAFRCTASPIVELTGSRAAV